MTATSIITNEIRSDSFVSDPDLHTSIDHHLSLTPDSLGHRVTNLSVSFWRTPISSGHTCADYGCFDVAIDLNFDFPSDV